MGKIDWDVVTNYTDVVTTTLKTVTFPKVQEQVYLRNQGNANITYTIGSQSGTLTPGQSVTVNQDVSSYTVQAVSGTHTFELRAKEKGTEIIETDNNLPSDVSGQLTSITSQLAEKAKQSDLDNTNTTLASKLTKGLAQVTLADLSQEVKTSMTGGSVAVVGENAVLNATIGDNQVTTGKSNYFIKKGNLFDKNHPNNIMNWNIYTSGTEAAQNGFFASYYIPITEGLTYICNKSKIWFYNASKVLIGTGYDMAVAVVAPTGARYARIACATSLLGTTMLLNSSTIPSTYVPFAIFDTSLIDTDNIGYTQKTRLGEKLSIIQPSTGALPDIDIINKKITFPDDTILVWGKSNLILNASNGNNVIDFSGQASSAVAIYLDTKTLTFSALNYASGSGISENNVLLCTFRSKNGLGSFPGKYTVNGVDIFGVSKKKAVESPLVLPAKTRLAGHRGLRNLAPENTLASFDLTGQKGLFAIETDIYETTDGVFVCIHDSTVDAMTNGTGNVRDYTFAQLQQFTIDSGTNIANYSNLKIPRIEDYLKICRKYGCVPYIELKGISNYQNLITILQQLGMENSCIFQVDNTNDLTTLRTYTKAMALLVGLDTSVPSTLITSLLNYENVGLQLHVATVTEDVVKSAHLNGMIVSVWNVNDTTMLNTFVNYGVDIVTTDQLLSVI